MTKPLLLVIFFAALTGCGPSDPVEPAPPPDLGPLVASVSPDGAGYCCEPRRWGNCGSPSFYAGGFAAMTRDCLNSYRDVIWVPTTREYVDAHGCVTLDHTTGLSCLVFDAGAADAGLEDASIEDASVEDASVEDASVDSGP